MANQVIFDIGGWWIKCPFTACRVNDRGSMSIHALNEIQGWINFGSQQCLVNIFVALLANCDYTQYPANMCEVH